jgi:succinyl-diaminopimelate desuccinylase
MNAALALTQDLIRIPSLTPLEPGLLVVAKATLDLLEARALASGGRPWRLPAAGGHSRWNYTVDNLYVEWLKGTPRQGLCFIGHTDVVPAGDAEAWSVDPYSGEIKNGFLYGRGATDMKGAVAAFFTAVEDVLSSLDDVRIGAIITTDEEWAAINGTRHVLCWLKTENKGFPAFLAGEPSSRAVLGSHVKIGRRGSLVGRLIADGVQGHAAYPDGFINPNRALSLASTILQGLEWDDATVSMPATQFQPVALQSGSFEASAVIPRRAEALWNIRFTPRQTPEALVLHLQTALINPPAWARQHADAPLLERLHVHGNFDTAALPYLSPPGRLTAAALTAIAKVLGRRPVLDCGGGTTDGRFVRQIFPDAEVIEIGPPENGGTLPDHDGDLTASERGGMHQIDERISVKDLSNLQHIYGRLLHDFSTGLA